MVLVPQLEALLPAPAFLVPGDCVRHVVALHPLYYRAAFCAHRLSEQESLKSFSAQDRDRGRAERALEFRYLSSA